MDKYYIDNLKLYDDVLASQITAIQTEDIPNDNFKKNIMNSYIDKIDLNLLFDKGRQFEDNLCNKIKNHFENDACIVYKYDGNYSYQLVKDKYLETIECIKKGVPIIWDTGSIEKHISDTLIIPDVLFNFNKSTLNPRFIKELDAITGKLKDRQFSGLEVTGHTDSIGTADYNLDFKLNIYFFIGYMEHPQYFRGCCKTKVNAILLLISS